ncbi:hypothetical protein C6988_03840 [Nitrosopumilus sp. b1]|uniref:hypothetical protein n=1 Tax=Nitrosopumilus sp. b1 TaxID=2109907 RepID=UPI0015F36D05|nr:hypothetical protein [Nitrosopumilus sp. b1]KAF6243384.1 hypothetical protein C6988_03840 [Nitrosopumilus sp. b1]
MNLTPEDKNELESILQIVTNQIPNYFNLINPSKNDWEIENVEDCVFGMVFNSFVSKSTEYLKNMIIDKNPESDLNSNLEYFETTINFFNAKIPHVKQAIVSVSKS